MFLSAVLGLCCISMVDSTCSTNPCDISTEKSMIASMVQCMLQSIENKIKASSECTAPENCPAGWKKYKTHCYFFSPDGKNWHDAAKQCQTMGGYLAKITDSEENSWVVDMITKSVKHKYGYWMGMADLKNEGDWRWVNDSSAVSYSNWNGGQPDNASNEDCGHFWPAVNYEWNDIMCNIDQMGYICECSDASNCRPSKG
ncbi:perlucin-like protein [Mytilus galloprovincialis]|uniref:perlucin-like protein n=1 Tax=Mytilus galloprovincialis TaxID=29158 RepID=UPI003F7BC7C5